MGDQPNFIQLEAHITFQGCKMHNVDAAEYIQIGLNPTASNVNHNNGWVPREQGPMQKATL